MEWYIRLEQGRGENPSPSVLDALARALRLTEDERAHLYALGRAERIWSQDAMEEVPDGSLQRMLRTLPAQTPGYILGRRWDILDWNAGAAELLIDFGTVPAPSRNLIELTFGDEAMRARYADWADVARLTLANFRAAVARHLGLPEVRELIDRLSRTDEHFAEWWALHEVAEKSAGVKRFCGPAGQIVFMRFDSVLSPVEPDQRLIVYTPASSAEG